MQSKILLILISSIVARFVDAERSGVPSTESCAAYPNEEFAIDLGRCQNTCQFYGRTFDCPDYYKPRGDCYCKAGYARLVEDGECVSVTDDAVCASELSIQPEQCGVDESYQEYIGGEIFVETCLTVGISTSNNLQIKRWAPHCICKANYKRLSDGTCVPEDDASCVNESKLSPERCAALGQIYQENAACQLGCYGQNYCPPATGACVCPSNKIPHAYEAYYGGQFNDMISCHFDESDCPIVPP